MQTDLVERAMHGDHDAFAELIRGSWARLFGTAGLILRDAAAVQDATQAAIIRAWRDLPTLRDPTRFDAWLYRLLINACRDEARRLQRTRRTRAGLDEADLAAPHGDLAWLEQRDELDRAFARLTEEQRTILTLVFYDDMTVPQAAAAIGTRLGTAKSRLHRALEALRAAIAAERRPSMEREMRT